jgi:hypothetical membrane protein
MTKRIYKLFKIIPGGIFGLLSVIIIIIGDFLAYLSFPGYNVYKNMVSDLGIGPGGTFFNISIIISGIIIIPYYINLAKLFKGKDILPNLRKYAIFTSIISCITYSLLGFFPATKDDKMIFIAHGVLATISIATGLGYLLLFSILMIKAENFSNIQAYHGFMVALLYFLFLITWNSLLEWIMNFAIISWIIINSLYILYLNFNSKYYLH